MDSRRAECRDQAMGLRGGELIKSMGVLVWTGLTVFLRPFKFFEKQDFAQFVSRKGLSSRGVFGCKDNWPLVGT